MFEVPAESLLANEPGPSEPVLKAMREGVMRGLDFTGVTSAIAFPEKPWTIWPANGG
ncbi:MAG: hypothetical protein WD397_07760 [Wenzhouxiangellaceae bacterium]